VHLISLSLLTLWLLITRCENVGGWIGLIDFTLWYISNSVVNRAVVLLCHMFFWLSGFFTSSIVWRIESNRLGLFHPGTGGWGDTYLILSDRKMYSQHPENLSLCTTVAKIIASAVFSHCFPALGIIICCGQCGGTPNKFRGTQYKHKM